MRTDAARMRTDAARIIALDDIKQAGADGGKRNRRIVAAGDARGLRVRRNGIVAFEVRADSIGASR
jgi:hypothetical protein